MDSIHTYYDVLMVSRNASQEVIRAAFKSLCQKYHPDRNKHPNAERMIQQFNEAYSILSNPVERDKYDKQLSDYEKKVNQTHQERSYNQFKDEAPSDTSQQKNNIVIINIPDSISLDKVKISVINLVSKAKPIFIKTFKVVFCFILLIVIVNILFALIENFSPDSALEDLDSASEDLAYAQQEVQDAAQELDEASEEYDYYEEYPYQTDTSEYVAADQAIEQNIADIPVDEDYISSDDSSAYKNYAPNGESFPSSAGYVAGYPVLNNDGASILTIDNSQNNEAIFGKLYYLDEMQDSAVRHFYIQGGGGFNIRDISPGNYDVRYKDLENGSISKSEPIQIEEYQEYDGIRFSNISMTLYKVTDGNMQTYSISESEF